MKILKKKESIFVLLLPAFIIYLILFLYPIFGSFRYSLYDWNGFGDMSFVGLNNYRELFRDNVFYLCLKNTLVYMFFGGICIFFLSFLFTFYLINIKTNFKKIFRAIIILPYMISAVAIANIWNYIYNPGFGLINSLLRLVKLDSLTQSWTKPDTIIFAISIALIWYQVGFYTITMLAATEKIPPDYYEVADIFGANKLQKFIHVTIPFIMNEIEVCLIFWIITAIKMFELIFAFSTSTDPMQQTFTLSVYMYIIAFGRMTPVYRFGYASAIAVSLVLISFVSAGLVLIIMKRRQGFEY